MLACMLLCVCVCACVCVSLLFKVVLHFYGYSLLAIILKFFFRIEDNRNSRANFVCEEAAILMEIL